MKPQYIIMTFITLAILIVGCRKDDFTTQVNQTPPTPIDYFPTTIEGFVVGEDGSGLHDATVTLGTESTVTNELGYFTLSGVGKSTHTLISVSKDGYFDNFKSYVPSKNLNATSQTRVQLNKRLAVGTMDASSGGTFLIGDNSQVTFQPDNLVDASGNPYNGMAIIYAHYIDPSLDNIDQVMPGNLTAINADGEMNVLQSFGMLNIQIEATSGEPLNISAPATLEVAVPSALMDKAPAQLPLWYFDESDGLWKEEGSAAYQGGKYIGEVNHFTTWNCDVPFETAFIEGQVIDDQGVSAIKVHLEDQTTGAIYTLWTDSDGFFYGFVPIDIEFTLSIKGLCESEDAIYTQEIGPYPDGIFDLGVIDISNNNGFTLVSGILVDCDMTPIPNGEVYFDYPTFNYTVQTETNAQGNFRVFIPSCEGEDVEMRGINPETSLVSDIITVNIDGELQDVGTLSVCIDISPTLGAVKLIYNGTEKDFDNCTVDLQENNMGATSYVFTYSELLPPLNDPISYIMILSESNNSLVNPSWSYDYVFWSPPTSAEDEEYEYFVPNFNTNVQNISTVVLQAADSPGEILKLNLRDITIGYRIKNVANSWVNYVGDIEIEAVVLQ